MASGIDRRSLLCSAAEAVALCLIPRVAAGRQVPADDGRLVSERVTTRTSGASGFLVRPRPRAGAGVFVGPERYASILVIDERRGLDAWVEAAARRLALESFMTFAPETRTIDGLHASALWLQNHPQSTGRLGLLAFSSDGDLARLLAARLGADLHASVTLDGDTGITDAAWQRAALSFIQSLT